MIEKWKRIKNFPDYEISNLGRVKSFKRKTPIILKPALNQGGYPVVNIYNGKGTTRLVHRLVAEAFLANPDNKKCVNHKDSNRKNPRASNLEWCTHKENIRHAFKKGNMNGGINPNPAKGENHFNSKLNKDSVIKIRDLYDSGVNELKIAVMFDVQPQTIVKVAERRSWKHIP